MPALTARALDLDARSDADPEQLLASFSGRPPMTQSPGGQRLGAARVQHVRAMVSHIAFFGAGSIDSATMSKANRYQST